MSFWDDFLQTPSPQPDYSQWSVSPSDSAPQQFGGSPPSFDWNTYLNPSTGPASGVQSPPSSTAFSWDSFLNPGATPTSPTAPAASPTTNHAAIWGEDSTLMNILDFINSPQQALLGMIAGKTPLQGMRENTSGADVVRHFAGKTPDQALSPFEWGLAGATQLIDPLMFVPEKWVGSAMKGAGEGLTLGAKAVNDFLSQSETYAAIAAKIKPYIVEAAQKISPTAFKSEIFKKFYPYEDLSGELLSNTEAAIKQEFGKDIGKAVGGYEAKDAATLIRQALEAKTPDVMGLDKALNRVDNIMNSAPEDAYGYYKDLAKITGDDSFLDIRGAQPVPALKEDLYSRVATALRAKKRAYLETADVRNILDEGAQEKFYRGNGVPDVAPLPATHPSFEDQTGWVKPTPDLPSGSPLSDGAPWPLENLAVTRQQTTAGAAEYSPLRKGTWFNLGEEANAVYKGAGGVNGGENLIKMTVNPVNPLVIVSDRPGWRAGAHALGRVMGNEYAESVLKMDIPELMAEAVNRFKIPLADVEEMASKPIAIVDRMATEAARSQGFDSIIWSATDGKYGEYVALNPITTGTQRMLKDTKATMDLVNSMDRLPPSIIDKALEYKKAADDAYLVDRRILGRGAKYLDDVNNDYLLHMLTPEAKAAVVKAYEPTFGVKKYMPVHASQLGRDLSGSIDEINALARDGNLPGKLAGIRVDKFFEDDPIALTAFRKMRSAKIEADYELLRNAATMFGKVGADAPANYVPLSLATNPDTRLGGLAKEFAGVKFHPEIASHLNAALTFATKPEATGAFVRLLEQVRGVWAPATLFSPFGIVPTSFKNFIGNVYNNSLAGIRSPKFYRIMQQIQFRDPALKEVVLNGKTYSIEALKKLMTDFAVSGTDYGTSELQAFTRMFGKESLVMRAPGGVGTYFKKAAHAYRLVEDNARGAHFLHMLDQGLDPMAARVSVRKYLFDYNVSRLMPWEKNLRLFMPFFMWTRNNLPLQLTSLITNPGNRTFVRLAELTSLAKHIYQGDTPEHRLDGFHTQILPQFVRDQVGLPIRLDGNGNPEYFMLGNWIPTADLESLASPRGALRKLYGLIAPYIKEPVEQYYNYDAFLQRQIAQYPGETQRWMGLDVPRRLVHITKLLRFVNELDKMTQGAMDDTLKPDERDAFTKIMRMLTGATTYIVNVPYQTMKNQREINQIVARLQREANPANQEALQAYLQELVQQ